MYTVTVEAKPKYDESKDPRTTGGAFTISQRMPRDLWDKLKSHGWCWYVSNDDIEDFGNYGAQPGWRYNVEALRLIVRQGNELLVDGEKVTSTRGLSDLWSPAGMAAQQAKVDAEKAEEARREAIKARIGEIAGYIRDAGERPEGSQAVNGEMILDSGNIYGSGRWFTITPYHIWYVKNNGGDGDNWASNNVITGGAGAIGWRIPFNQVIADELRRLANGQLSRDFTLPALPEKPATPSDTLSDFFQD
jgi:hypothetical protein